MTPDLAQALAAAGLEVVPTGEVERLRAKILEIAGIFNGWANEGRMAPSPARRLLAASAALTAIRAVLGTPWQDSTAGTEGTR